MLIELITMFIMPIFLPAYLPNHLVTYLSALLPSCLVSVRLLPCLPAYLAVCLPASLAVCLPATSLALSPVCLVPCPQRPYQARLVAPQPCWRSSDSATSNMSLNTK